MDLITSSDGGALKRNVLMRDLGPQLALEMLSLLPLEQVFFCS